jgi:hypothetical protein
MLTLVSPGRYWMYAAVRAGQQGILVSNDEMRDHIFQVRLLMSCRHVTASDVEEPAYCSVCVQFCSVAVQPAVCLSHLGWVGDVICR